MIITQIKKIVASQLGTDASTITDDADLVNNLGADSLDLVEIVMELEKEFKITIEDCEYTGSKTPAAIGKLVESKLS